MRLSNSSSAPLSPSRRILITLTTFLLGVKSIKAFVVIPNSISTSTKLIKGIRINQSQSTTSSTTNNNERKYITTSNNDDSNTKKKSSSEATTRKINNDHEWSFFDTARINVSGGDGGKGCVAFRREKGAPRGGPSGGRGGSGGSVWLVCDESLNTLAPIRQTVHTRGGNGLGGKGKDLNGCYGKDKELRVPPGTIVRDLNNKFAGELREHGERLLAAKGGRGGRGNAAFERPRYTAPKIAERGEPGASRWLSIELRLVADIGFVGKPNAGKSTLLAAASAARPKIANYPFTTIIPNLGVCDLDGGQGLVLCDIPGLIHGAALGAGLGQAFLRHVQRCKVLVHLIDATSDEPFEDFITINNELEQYDATLALKPQVVVLNKLDVFSEEEQQQQKDMFTEKLKSLSGHTRVMCISAVTGLGVKELMYRLKKFVDAQPDDDLPPPPTEINLSQVGLEADSMDYEIVSDPAYPNQWRIKGTYIEQTAKMTHWEYPEAIERFGRQLYALGISKQLLNRGAIKGDLVMINVYDFDFDGGHGKRGMNPYIPMELLEKEEQDRLKYKSTEMLQNRLDAEFLKSEGISVEDATELVGFGEEDEWDLMDDGTDSDGDDNEERDFDTNQEEEFFFDDEDDVWMS